MRRPSYDRVPTTESEHEHPRDNTNSSSHFSEDEIKIKTKYDWILEKIHALIWIILAIFVARYTRLIHVLDESPNNYKLMIDDGKVERSSPPIQSASSASMKKPHRLLLYGAILLVMINLMILLYLTVYLPCVRNIHGITAWNVYHPRAIPTMILCGFFSIFLFIRSLWPLYGWTTPFILAIELMGCMSLLHFLPWK